MKVIVIHTAKLLHHRHRPSSGGCYLHHPYDKGIFLTLMINGLTFVTLIESTSLSSHL